MLNKTINKKSFSVIALSFLVISLFVFSCISGYTLATQYKKTLEKAYDQSLNKISNYVINFEDEFMDIINSSTRI